jgi:bifunctional UDP-N-acetylglucosamine pyrophosphorylase/glucosamine-1-phosphate N-acetyltransferase
MPASRTSTCAIIPAAGRGSRLGLEGPKLLVPVTEEETVWSLLRRKLSGLVDGVHVVISPAHLEAVRAATAALEADDGLPTTLAVQERPTGMGDAVFCGWSHWRDTRAVLVVWGDQVHISRESLARAFRCHGGGADRVVLPLVSLPQPYVEYRFDDVGRLSAVLQAREGDECRPNGRGDVGTFVLSTPRLVQEWERFRADSLPGARTGEVNFLPFLVRLAQRGWTVQPIDVGDPREARGINTAEDLAFFRQLYAERRSRPAGD